MLIPFNKYEGTGNDFIIIRNTPQVIQLTDHQLISRLCDRRFGIGADGLILIEDCKGYDFRMQFFNSDGYPATMCGNGGRCAARFVMSGNSGMKPLTFMAADGEHHARSLGNDIIDLSINDVNDIKIAADGIVINTGVPHLVIFRDDIEKADLVAIARPLRYSQTYAPEGVNVNLVQVKGKTLMVRTYERGVEAETLSCGTGVTASAIAAVKAGKIVTVKAEGEVEVKAEVEAEAEGEVEVEVEVKGGRLKVAFSLKNDSATNIHLTGPGKFVFSGEIEI